MPDSLFIEHYDDQIAFYINGDLQFYTVDEQIYHEYLVIPAIALAIERFPHQSLRVLICGGGDGLAARDILRFPQVSQIDLVDYNPEVIALGKTTFSSYNHNSLNHPKVAIHTQEAFAFLSTLAKQQNLYHVVICDFTSPRSAEDTRVYAQEWFQLINSVLYANGILAENAVSSDRQARAFWCLYRTLLASGFDAKPMHIEIPSFQHHDYGTTWGFFLASKTAITKPELERIVLPIELSTLSLEKLWATFIFTEAIAAIRHTVTIHTLTAPRLFYYLLNPGSVEEELAESDCSSPKVLCNFLDLQETITQLNTPIPAPALPNLETLDPLQLESLAKMWLHQMEESSNPATLETLLPVQHPYHTSIMLREWLGSIKQLLAQIDLSQLFQKIQERGKNLPPQVIKDVQEFAAKLKDAKSSDSLFPEDYPINSLTSSNQSTSKTAGQVLMMLSLTLLVANVIAPDAVFAKGSYVGGSGNGGDGWGFLGFMMTMAGIVWLSNLADEGSNRNSN